MWLEGLSCRSRKLGTVEKGICDVKLLKYLSKGADGFYVAFGEDALRRILIYTGFGAYMRLTNH